MQASSADACHKATPDCEIPRLSAVDAGGAIANRLEGYFAINAVVSLAP